MSRRMAAHQDQISVSGSPVDFKKIQRDAVTPEELEVVRQKISAAAYTLGGQDLKRLFQHIDKDHSNSVDEEEFINFVRRVLKLSPKTVSEGQISACFHAIDADGNGTIEFSELIAFVGKFDMSSKESLEAFLEKKKAIDQVLKEAEDDDAFRQYATVTPSLHQMEATNSAENLIHLSSPTALISGGWAEIKHSLRASPQSPDENRDQSIPEDPAHFRQSLSQIVEKFGQFGVPRNGRKSFGELDAIEIRAAAAKLHTGLRRKLAMDKIHIDSNNIEKLLIDECSSYPPALSPNDKRKQKRNAKLFVVSKFQRICRSAAQTVGARWDAIFRLYDSNKNGCVSYIDIYRIVRRELRIPKLLFTDTEVAIVLQVLDPAGREAVDIYTWLGFVADDENSSAYTNDNSKVNQTISDTPEHSQHYIPYDAPFRPRKALHRGSLRPSPSKLEQTQKVQNKKKILEHARTRMRNAVYRLKSVPDGWAGVIAAWQPKLQDYEGFIQSVRSLFRISKVSLSDEILRSLAFHLDESKCGKVEFNNLMQFVSRDSEVQKEVRIGSVTQQELENVRCKITAAAYTLGGKNVTQLFKEIDKDHSGGIDEEEFISMVRRKIKIPPNIISDAQASAVFRAIDIDCSGTIEVDELMLFTEKKVDIQSMRDSLKREQKNNRKKKGKAANEDMILDSMIAFKDIPAELQNICSKILAATFIAGVDDLSSLIQTELSPCLRGEYIELDHVATFIRNKLNISSSIIDNKAFSEVAKFLSSDATDSAIGGSEENMMSQYVNFNRLLMFIRGMKQSLSDGNEKDKSHAKEHVVGLRRRIAAEDLLNAVDAATAAAPTEEQNSIFSDSSSKSPYRLDEVKEKEKHKEVEEAGSMVHGSSDSSLHATIDSQSNESSKHEKSLQGKFDIFEGESMNTKHQDALKDCNFEKRLLHLEARLHASKGRTKTISSKMTKILCSLLDSPDVQDSARGAIEEVALLCLRLSTSLEDEEISHVST